MGTFLSLKFATVTAILFNVVNGYAVSPELNQRAIAGVWRLRGISSFPTKSQFPMKEFTTFPIKDQNTVEYLLSLKEDGTFSQYDNEEKKTEGGKSTTIKGAWDYHDGELILAADRPDGQQDDTMFVGTVVATSQASLHDNPALAQEDQTSSSIDTHLSVPKGNVQVGKFMYPKKHQMFFEQPMFQPIKMGAFELKQVLGSLNAALIVEEPELIEKFRKTDFSGKKFFLTNYPIPERKPKGDLRWSIKYNKFVEDPLPWKKKQIEKEEEKKTTSIRVMEVQLFDNNTFTTTAGLGDSTILRGKWGIHGDQRDRFWMQVWRFGFGRSVSGSTYSEGSMLSHNDDKTYWGQISYMEEDIEKKNKKEENELDSDASEVKENQRLQVKGSITIGYLEPQPVARFIMREELEDEEDLEDDDEEEEEELKFKMPEDDDGIDWSAAFQ
eukprot:CAMPEP_0194204010 /NCGR_PEP_ID=MMETSP0156-20130528/3644_1 /TAXON_ID=33649 /ORGANISM="Thalassionema nitzschioides, Strain L26-B" /LENGTH=440 /DNA_ID=CAMNT_0038929903 /DNA_START=196 /DNA_END=1518 /DNA_ORIENTATION=-